MPCGESPFSKGVDGWGTPDDDNANAVRFAKAEDRERLKEEEKIRKRDEKREEQEKRR